MEWHAMRVQRVSDTHTSLRDSSSWNTPGSMVDMMLPERFLSENKLDTSKSAPKLPHSTESHFFFWNEFICLLQFSEIGQPQEHVCSQAANAVVGQVAKSVRRQRNVLVTFELRGLVSGTQPQIVISWVFDWPCCFCDIRSKTNPTYRWNYVGPPM